VWKYAYQPEFSTKQASLFRVSTICMRVAASLARMWRWVDRWAGGKWGKIRFGSCNRLASNPKHNNENAASNKFGAHGANRNRGRNLQEMFSKALAEIQLFGSHCS